MFRATQIASEETLPALFDVTRSLKLRETFDDGETQQLIDAETSSLTKPSRSLSLKYGLTQILPPIKYKYPIAVFFVLGTKFFEAFAANGIRTILVLYLRDDLYFSESFSTIMLHVFNFFGQFCPIFGAILADSYFGNVRTISYFCFVYATGWIALLVTAFPYLGIPVSVLTSISLILLAIGNGSIRACITSLGAQQFKLPEQASQLAGYFSLYYFVYYFGILLSKILPPYERAKTQCFGKSDCYPAVFGTLAASFAMAWLILTIGKFYYKPERLVEENILIKFYGCIKHALFVKRSRINNNEPQPTYWLQNAIGKYDEDFVNDVGKVLKIAKLFIPLQMYFALLAQTDSSWTFQATLMNTTIMDTITIQPDQAKAMGPIFLFILIPAYLYIFTPLIRRLFGSEIKPLDSVMAGGVCSAFAFVCAGALQGHIYNSPYHSVNVAWQIPQFFLLMLGELLLSIPGLKFAFTQAPDSMKSVVTAAWFINNAFGNLIVVIITKLNLFASQTNEYFFYALLMVIAIIIFALMAHVFTTQQQASEFNSYTLLSNQREDEDKPSTSTTSIGSRRITI